MSERANIASIFLVSAGTLAFEVVLTRLFALAFWDYFAALLIALALTGFGTAGSLLVPLLGRLERDRRLALAVSALGASLAVVWAYLAVLAVGLEPLALVWTGRAWLDLLLVCAILTGPFILAGAHIALVLAWSASPSRAYAANLAGSGLGCLLAALSTGWLLPPQALYPAVGFIAAGFLVQVGGLDRRRLIIVAGLAAVLASLTLSRPLPLHFEPFKDRSAALAARGSQLKHRAVGLNGLIEVIGGPAFHHAPGLTLTCPAELPPQSGLFLDGDLLGPMTSLADGGPLPGFLDCLLTMLPHRIFEPQRVLVLNPGGGLGLLTALAGGAAEVVAVEEIPQVVDLLTGPLAGANHALAGREGVRLIQADAPLFIAQAGDSDEEVFDLVVLGDGTRWESGSTSGQGETRLLTVEGLSDLLDVLGPGGVLAVAGPIMTPPRATIKLLATIAQALRKRGGQPGSSLALIRDWRTALLLVKPDGFSPVEVQEIRLAAWRMGFDLSWLPGLSKAQTNRFHRLPGRPIFEAARLVIAGREAELYDKAFFDLRPASRDRPYFFHFFRPRTLALIAGGMEGRRLAVTEWGLLFIWGGLGTTILLAGAGILLPLGRLRPRPPGLAFFGLLGLGYMVAEITLLGEMIHRTGRPALAVPLTVGIFLVASGAGSRLWGDLPPRLFALASAAALPPTLIAVRHLPGGPLVAGLCLVPAALLMGAPFAGGLTHLVGPRPPARAWAFGVNGFLSVAGALVASLICLQAGHLAALLTAAGCYLAAGLTVRGGEK